MHVQEWYRSVKPNITIVIILGLLAGISFGMAYGVSNHNTYLLDGLRKLDPGFLQYDWLAAQTTHYHKTFSWIVWLFGNLGSVSVGLMLLNLVLVMASVGALYSLVRATAAEQWLLPLLLIVAFIIFTQTRSVAGSYMFSSYLQPSSLSSLWLIIAIVYFARAKYLVSGMFLGLSGFFHTNFLILGFVFFGIAHLGLGWKGVISRGVQQFLPSLLVLVLSIPTLIALSTSPNQEYARYIFQFVRSPHHYVPENFLVGIAAFIGFNLLGLAFSFINGEPRKIYRSLYVLHLTFFVLVVLATLATTIVFIPFVSQLFVWRMAPFSMLLTTVIVATNMVRCHKEPIAASPQRIFLGTSGFILIVGCYLSKANVSLTMSMFVLLMALVFAVLLLTVLSRKTNWFRKGIGIGIPLALGLSIIIQYPRAYVETPFLHTPVTGAREELFSWAKQTSPDSQFLIPLDMADFRLKTDRSIVVDWKSTPILPDELIEWYRRIQRVSGKQGVRSPREAYSGYAQMGEQTLKSLVEEFGISYAVFGAEKTNYTPLGPVAFKNDDYVVIETSGFAAR